MSIGGRVLTDSGAGIRNVIVTLTDSRGAFRTTSTGTFGMYRFEAVEVNAIRDHENQTGRLATDLILSALGQTIL